MEAFNRKKHWERIYQTKGDQEVSWYQEKPETALAFFTHFNIPKKARIIDVGGGNSRLAEYLLKAGYEHLTILDISETALENTKIKLGTLANRVKWIIADITTFQPEEQYDVWHDRAAFHFLTQENDIEAYLRAAQQGITANGLLMIATFSEQGPDKCSGLTITQYSSEKLTARLKDSFQKLKCINVDHITPFHTIQNFLYCCFKKQ